MIELSEAQREALINRTATRQVWLSLMSMRLVYWVPTTWLVSGGYFLTETGEALVNELQQEMIRDAILS